MSLALWEYFWTAGDWTTSNPATGIQLSGPASGTVNVASTNFTGTANNSISGVVVVTLVNTGGTGTFTPTTLSLSAGTLAQTFTYTPTNTGTHVITCTNNGALSNGTSLSYVVSAVVVAASGDLSTVGGGGGHKKDHGDPFPVDMDIVREAHLRRLHPEPAAEVAPKPSKVEAAPESVDLLRKASKHAMQIKVAQENIATQKKGAEQLVQLAKVQQDTTQLALDMLAVKRQYYNQAAIILLLDTF